MSATSADLSRWLSAAGRVAAGAFAALLVAMLATNWMVVDVRSPDRDHPRVTVPLPLNLLRVPLHMAPRASVRVPLTECAERQHARVLGALRALEQGPEGTVVPLLVDDAPVLLSRHGGRLLVALDGGRCGDSVRLTLPFAATLRLVERAAAGELEPRAVLDLLASSGRGELLAVEADDASVRVTTW